MVEPRGASSQPSKPVSSIQQDIHTLDSKISLIAQKLRTIEQNEDIIGRTIVAHNNKLKEMEEKLANLGNMPSSESAQSIEGSAANTQDLLDLKRQIEDLRKEVSEMRYVLNSINPLEFATLDQVKDLLNEKKA